MDLGSSDEAAPPPLFEEVTDSAGLTQVYDGEFHYFVGGGVATFDCNEDGLPDVYAAGGENPSGLFINQSDVAGDIRFSRLASAKTDLVGVTGAYPIDVDSDGFTDLAVLRLGENVMLRGQGGCNFERANEFWDIDGGDDWTVSFSAFWRPGDSLPTLAFGNYLRLLESGDRDQCEDHFVFGPRGDTFGPPETLTPGYCTLSILFSDWNRSGSTDLRMTNDRHYYAVGHEQLWRIDEPIPSEYTSDEGWQELKIWGMGIASHDLTDDGLPEVFLTSQGDNKLQTLVGDGDQPHYEDMALGAGVTAHRPFAGDTLQPSTAWHAEFDDVNNDGYVDLFVTKGNVDNQVGFAAEDPNNLLVGNPDGIFTEAADIAGLLDYERSRGASLVDVNLDGFLDVVVVERQSNMRIWRNTGEPAIEGSEPGNWLRIELAQPTENVDAIGAWIEVVAGDQTTTREVTIGGGHASGDLGWIHFGLGEANEARVRVKWPDGDTSEWETLIANQHVTWDRDSGPQTWSASRD